MRRNKIFSKKYLKLALCLVLVLIPVASVLAEAEISKEEVLLYLSLNILTNWHYEPGGLDDQFSRRVFDLYLKDLDYNKRFFTMEDLSRLQKYETLIDDELRAGRLDFYQTATALFQERARQVRNFTLKIMKTPFDFSIDERLEIDPKKRSYPVGDADLYEQWRKVLKYQTLQVYLSDEEIRKNTGEESTAGKKIQGEAVKKAQDKVGKSLLRSLDRILQEQSDREKSFSRFIKAIAGSFDPHTAYLSPLEMENFQIDMSGRLEGIGALLEDDGESIRVAEIFPGSPSWNQRELGVGDVILKVAQGDGEPVDVVNMPVNEAVKFIRGKPGTEVRLTVKKPDGQIAVIPIIRGVVILEETYAKSAVIVNESSGEKYGYISLPSFYHDSNLEDGRDSSDDLRGELMKLISAEVDGVILDLRNNSGGVLDDAVRMSGLFIENGPILQVRDSGRRAQALSDPDPEVYYDGPLVVLVNALSASASEIVSAALQDYGRAVIVGGANTFGKGSVQELIDLDEALRMLGNDFSDHMPLGVLKLTTKKYYRITGASPQSTGVISDIILPDLYSALDLGEGKLDYPLLKDTVASLKFRRWKKNLYNIEDLRRRSEERVAAEQGFGLLKESIRLTMKQQENTNLTLRLDEAIKEQEELKAKIAKVREVRVEPWLKAYLSDQYLREEGEQSVVKSAQGKLGAGDSSSKDSRESGGSESAQETVAEKTREWLEEIVMDLYILESAHILCDMAG